VDQVIWATATVLTAAIFIRILISWSSLLFPNLDPHNVFFDFIFTITEPILAPIRSVMPRGIMFDFSPMIAIILIQVISNVLMKSVSSG